MAINVSAVGAAGVHSFRRANVNDVENYIESLISEGIEIKEEIYSKCLSYFGVDLKHIIDDIFFYEED
jgi:hypothetical protein